VLDSFAKLRINLSCMTAKGEKEIGDRFIVVKTIWEFEKGYVPLSRLSSYVSRKNY